MSLLISGQAGVRPQELLDVDVVAAKQTIEEVVEGADPGGFFGHGTGHSQKAPETESGHGSASILAQLAPPSRISAPFWQRPSFSMRPQKGRMS